MKKFKAIIILFLLIGCEPIWVIDYTTIIDSDKANNNVYKDNNFEFIFYTVPNGIYFKIKNLTNKTAKLIWDESYFIWPDGNTFKPLNTDLLETEENLISKHDYQSTIPSHGNFARFTTAATKLDKFKVYKSTEIQNIFATINEYRDNINIKTSQNTYKITKEEEFYNTENYWPTILEINHQYTTDDNYVNDVLINLTNELLNNNNLGLGLMIKLDDKLLEYKFDFKISSISIYKKNETNYGNVYNLLYRSKLPDLKEWEKMIEE